jgi:arabinofuranan 3-O-arabinosyltransferase
MMEARDKLTRFEDKIFTEWRVRFYGTGVLVAFVLAVLLWWAVYQGVWVVRPDGTRSNIDFCWIWVSGHFAASSDPSRIYNNAVYATAQNTFYRPGECLFLHQYVYPPSFLFFTYPVGLLPYLTAFTVWVVGTFIIYETAVYAVVSRPAALIAAAAPVFVLKNIQFGHNGFLTAGLIGLALVSIERRPWLSGIFLGFLTYKPHFGVLFPLALLASRNWRALAGATAAALIFGIAAALAFGHETWSSFIHSLFDRNADLSPDTQAGLILQSVYGLLRWMGASPGISWAVHLCVAIPVAAAVWVVWARPVPHALKAALLCVALLVVTPYVGAYDLCILSIAAAFLVSDGISRGFLPGERTVMLGCAAGLFMLAVPINVMIYAALLILVIRRIAAVPSRARPPDVIQERTEEFPRARSSAYRGNRYAELVSDADTSWLGTLKP